MKIIFTIAICSLIVTTIIIIWGVSTHWKFVCNKRDNFKESTPKVLGFCFLIYDKINHEELWYNWLKNVDKKKYKIYIHYKNDIKLKYFEKYKLDNCIETKWGDISLVKAQNLLIKASINDNCTHQILLSNSCIPLKSFDYVYRKLNLGFSYFNLLPRDLHKHTKITGTTRMNISNIHKASQWCILAQHHSEIILKDKLIYKELSKCFAPDELVYLTILIMYGTKEGFKNEIIITTNSSTNATTFTNWSDMDYLYVHHNKGPKNYNIITKEEIDYLIKQPCLFGRKFKPECKVIQNKIPLLFDKKINNLSQYLTKLICQ